MQSMKYEDLISNPEEETQKVFTFAGIPLNLSPDMKEVFDIDLQKRKLLFLHGIKVKSY